MKHLSDPEADSGNVSQSPSKDIWRKIPFKQDKLPALEDPLEFRANLCSKNAKKLQTHSKELIVDIWAEKHLHIRQQHGDENGKRDGIEPEKVNALVQKAINHLLFYGSLVKSFCFLNYQNQHTPCIRIFLKAIDIPLPLNVLIEVHASGLQSYEITIITALRTDDFRMTDGQHMVEFQQDGSLLKQKIGKIWKEITNFNL